MKASTCIYIIDNLWRALLILAIRKKKAAYFDSCWLPVKIVTTVSGEMEPTLFLGDDRGKKWVISNSFFQHSYEETFSV